MSDSHLNFFQKTALIRWFVAIVIFICAVFLRLAILPLNAGVIFITFYPATVLCFYLCGIRAGLFVACLSGLTGYYLFTPPYFSFDFNYTALVASGCYFTFVTLIGIIIKRFQDNLLALKISEQRYFHILEHQSEIICKFEIDGTILYVNEAFCRLFGKSKEELVGKKWFLLSPEEDVKYINEQLANISIDNPIVVVENRIIMANGEVRWGHFVNKGFFDAEGHLIELQSVGRDITKKKKLEEGNIKMVKELQILWEKERSHRVEQSQFMAMLAHELKNPLATIQLALGLISESDEILHLANKAIQDIQALIQRCLESEKLNDQKIVICLEKQNLCNQFQQITQSTNSANRLAINVEPSWIVETDGQLLHSILFNLIDNALKYSPADSLITVNVQKEEAYFSITVQNKIGIAGFPEESKVFQKYYRNKAAHHEIGSGLGLYLVKTMTSLLCGEIHYSHDNNFVCFNLLLPFSINQPVNYAHEYRRY